MTVMTISVLDAERAIHTRADAGFVNVLIPALSDAPETIDELQHAMRRFVPPEDGGEILAGWAAGECDRPLETGICLIDLAARLIVYQSTEGEFQRHGKVTFGAVDEDAATRARWIPYRLAGEWLVTAQLDSWKSLAAQRSRQRQANPPFDTRAVLYGRVIEFIADECFAARGDAAGVDGAWTPPAGWQWRELPERASGGQPLHASDAVAEIHARWLMTPREDLRGQTPREVLQAKRSELSWQLQDRAEQWTRFRQCPPPLWRESRAYRYGGYGTNEIVLYYRLVRHLIQACWDWVVEGRSDDSGAWLQGAERSARESQARMGSARESRPTWGLTKAAVIERLGAAAQEWLHTPDDKLWRGKSPVYVIQRERLRLPLGISGQEAMIDCDCPLCQMMADSGPFFWDLDHRQMDPEFPFALSFATREAWAEEQRFKAEWEAEWEREQQEGAGSGEDDMAWLHDQVVEESSPVWQRSFGYRRQCDSPADNVFGIGAHLAELIVDLREAGESQDSIDTLNGDFRSLRKAVADPSGSFVDPVVWRFGEHLASLSALRPEFSAKCRDLERQLDEFARRLSGEPEMDDEIPF